MRLTPDGRGAADVSVLLEGLNQPHGITFAGATLYVAESDRVRRLLLRRRAPRPIRGRSPRAPRREEPGAGRAVRARAQERRRRAGRRRSTSRSGRPATSRVEDRDGRPASGRRSCGSRRAAARPSRSRRGVRNGTGLAVAPDGAVWTAVNNRDNIPYPFDRPYGERRRGRRSGEVIADYVARPPGRGAGPAHARAATWAGRTATRTPTCSPASPAAPSTCPTPVRERRRDQPRRPRSSTAPPCRRSSRRSARHSAPLGLRLRRRTLPAPYAQGALVGRARLVEPRSRPARPRCRSSRGGAATSAAQQTLVGGFQAPDGSRWGRPVAAVAGPDGAVYVTDDEAGAVYRLAPPGR